ncbi:MAG: hypothetical protein EBR09_03975 [Proteobacteria bacterium]|nr:hypothetical protein [Pseudomonadota bacterium]
MNQPWYEPPVKMSFKERIARLRRAVMSRLTFRKDAAGRNRSSRSLADSMIVRKIAKKFTGFLFAFGHWFQLSILPVLRKFDWKLIQGVAAVLVVSFFLANSISTFAASGVMSLTRSAAAKAKPKGAAAADAPEASMTGLVSLPNPQKANGTSLTKDIIGRNLFNSEGKIPDEIKEESKKTKKDLTLNFDNEPCVSGELPAKIAITGTIFTGDPKKSWVILKDEKINDADIYKPGDAIIDHDDYEIYSVQRGALEIRKGNTKICVAIKGFEQKGMQASSAPSAGTPSMSDTKSFEFDDAFLKEELGPGNAKILNCARLIPFVEGGKNKGFRLASIATSCLFDRIELKNGDLITEVNGTSLTDATQGYRIWEALSESRTTTINALRDGQPITRTVRVK